MILVDAAAVPDHPSGVRTRLRGLFEAYGRLTAAPPVTIQVARGSGLFHGVSLGPVRLREVGAGGGPWRRVLRRRAVADADLALWHSETLPSRGPRSVPNLLTLHDLRHHHPRAEVGGTVLGHMARGLAARFLLPGWVWDMAAVVTVSEASARLMRTRFPLPAERVRVVPNARAGLPLQSSPPDADAAQRWTAGRPFFLAVGHLERRKHLTLLLQALAAGAGGSLDRAILVLVGAGPERPRLEQAVRRHGLGDRVVFAGRRDDAAVAGLLDAAVALLFPSLVEGFGFPVFEALGRGCPVIASPLPCLSDLDPRAVRFTAAEPGAWAAAMAEGLADPAGGRARARAEAERWREETWDRSARRLADLWELVSH